MRAEISKESVLNVNSNSNLSKYKDVLLFFISNPLYNTGLLKNSFLAMIILSLFILKTGTDFKFE